MIRKIVCKNTNNSIGTVIGLTLGNTYEIIDSDNIGYLIKNDFCEVSWYSKELFFQKEELRESFLSYLLYENKPINVLNYLDNITGVQYMSDDIICILLKELINLGNYSIIKINSIYHYTGTGIWRISYSYSDGKILASNLVDIINLDVKIRDLKIGNII